MTWMLAMLSLLLAQPASGAAPVNAKVFQTVDVVIDAGDQPLAAYQVDVRDVSGGGSVKIVGIEGGESVFAQPPFYDPAAMQHERVILAAFSTQASDQLPTGPVRVATIHIERDANATPRWEAKLITAGNAAGDAIEAKASVK